ncbi:M10 family metallopeptidase C-terminal domain-containing protein [Pseudomonas yamanorum]|uniref:M10 family metallopeptidase C-terminal domain-containing protein n=1 Tax=Pseudomonas yamanorum TaxID=515393 RepID=UPI0015A1639C|nr:M10 family metallopeptidase C-terminal domain-containing protein [Pseudomonas yamanorum]NWD22568.1 M10 family metallopeptidase C-terminal domain-containing protein [Pseudomonas yamanorum]
MSNMQVSPNTTSTNTHAGNYSNAASEESKKTQPSQNYGEGSSANQSPGPTRKWHDRNNDGVTSLTYEYPTLKNPLPGQKVYNPADSVRGNALTRVMQEWSDVANVTFTESKSRGEGHLHINHTPDSGVPGATPSEESVSMGSGRFRDDIYRHSGLRNIGSALGIPTTPTTAEGNDTSDVSVMGNQGSRMDSYGRKDWKYQPTLLMKDMEMAQQLYGANYNTRNTDTVYGFNSNADRDHYRIQEGTTSATNEFSIWDGGGNDTLDFSGFGQDQLLNLSAGSFSNVGGGVKNVSIAKGVTIENAKGGTGNDKIIGNQANNVIVGGGGQDQLWGVGGNNTFKYNQVSDSTHDKADCLMDFVSGKDKIDITEAMTKAGVTPRLVQNFTGTPGDAVMGFHPTDKLYYLAIDTSGNGKTDFLIKSTKPIDPRDIVMPH